MPRSETPLRERVREMIEQIPSGPRVQVPPFFTDGDMLAWFTARAASEDVQRCHLIARAMREYMEREEAQRSRSRSRKLQAVPLKKYRREGRG